MTDKLRKSCRTYRTMLARIPLVEFMTTPRSPAYRQVLDYYRALIAEFGNDNVRAALREVTQHDRLRRHHD
jgi:hypothetical protein